MKISKKDALIWFRFFSELPEGEELMPRQEEIIYATLCQIERAVEARRDAMARNIKGLNSLNGRSLYVGDEKKFPRGCLSCLMGDGLGAIRRTNKCNLNCRFCYDFGVKDQIPPVGEDLWEIGGTKFYERDLELLFSVQKKPSGVAYVYLEPFMEIETYYGVIRKFHEAGVHQHLYTNGSLATEETLRALSEAGLDEIRFNLGATNCADGVIENMRIAKALFPQAGIETPMTPEFFESFQKKKRAILDTGIDFINCAELHLNENNLGNYLGENLYMTRLGYLSPIYSRDLTLEFMRIADEEGWETLVHDCSNLTKFARDLNLKSREGGWFGASDYAREFSAIPCAAFLPLLADDGFEFLSEEPLPKGYRPGDLAF